VLALRFPQGCRFSETVEPLLQVLLQILPKECQPRSTSMLQHCNARFDTFIEFRTSLLRWACLSEDTNAGLLQGLLRV
jgi:hypothetical protein